MKAWENVGQSRADALASAILAAAFPPLSDGVHAESKPAAVADNIRTNGFNFIRSEEHTSELQSLMRISYAVFSLKKKTTTKTPDKTTNGMQSSDYKNTPETTHK